MMSRRVAVVAVAAALAAAAFGSWAAGGVASRQIGFPAALPADVPLPAAARLRSARDQGAKGLTLVFETDEAVAASGGGLRARLEAAGWTLLSEVAVGEAVFASYRKGARSVALGISRTGGVTVVGVAYRQPGPAQEGAPG
jgi:hypothetical protein